MSICKYSECSNQGDLLYQTQKVEAEEIKIEK